MILPFCAVCNKPVYEIVHEIDPEYGTHIWKIRCHGEEGIIKADGPLEIGIVFNIKPIEE